MTLILELTPKQERQLRAEAEPRGLDEVSYAKSRLFAEEIGTEVEQVPLNQPKKNGAVRTWSLTGSVKA